MSADTPAPAPRKKRMTVFDALDGALAKVKGLDEAAARAKTLPFKLHSEPADPYGKNPGNQMDAHEKEQDKRAGQRSKTKGQDNRAGQEDNRAGQRNRTKEQDKRAVQLGTMLGQDKGAGQRGRTIEQDNRAPKQDSSEPSRGYIPVLLDSPAAARTPAQRRVLNYFETHGSHVSNYDKIIKETGLPYNTVRKGINKLIAAGCLSKTRWSQGSARGLLFTYHGQTGSFNRAEQKSSLIGQNNGAEQRGRTKEQDNRAEQRSTPIMKIDRKNLSISLTTLQTSWPTLARAGFGLEQIEQIHAALAQLGKSPDRIVQGLDHAEWELAEGKMLDKQGQSVADPCAWVYRSLASQGYYRRPAGYVSAEEQAERDAIEEAKALARTRENARQERFRAWLQSLGGEEKENVLTGRIGPEEAWLKKEWAKRGEPH